MLLNDTKIEQENRGSEGLNVNSQTDPLITEGSAERQEPYPGQDNKPGAGSFEEASSVKNLKRRGKVQGK